MHRQLHGISAAPGITIGPAFQLHESVIRVDQQLVRDIPSELQLLADARRLAIAELEALYARATLAVGADHATIFDAHLAFLEDPGLFEEIEAQIVHSQQSAAYAVSHLFDETSAALAAGDDPVFQARAADLQDIKQRLVRLLTGTQVALIQPGVPSVVLAQDLLPSQILLLDRKLVLALCTSTGGATSHVAILARGLGLPAIVGLGPELHGIPDGTTLAVDGSAGIVHVDPPGNLVAALRARHDLEQDVRAQALAQAHLPAHTRDGLHVAVCANISTDMEAVEAQRHGAEGVGLLRTELLFMDRERAPSEDEQLVAYRAIADAIGRRPVTIRTLDIGGDKPVGYLQQASEQNPALGMRGIRLRHAHPELLRAQLRAIWRIGPGYPISVLFPMVSTIDELYQLRQLVSETRAELLAEDVALLDTLAIGIMVEVPSVALLAQHFAPLVDFFSIGTNDLAQYTLAADRTNAGLSYLNDPLHPAVLSLIAQTVSAARSYGRQVGVCGEVAADLSAVELLLGLGVTSLSMAPTHIPLAKATIRTLDSHAAITQARAALQLPNSVAVRALLASTAPAPAHG